MGRHENPAPPIACSSTSRSSTARARHGGSPSADRTARMRGRFDRHRGGYRRCRRGGRRRRPEIAVRSLVRRLFASSAGSTAPRSLISTRAPGMLRQSGDEHTRHRHPVPPDRHRRRGRSRTRPTYAPGTRPRPDPALLSRSSRPPLTCGSARNGSPPRLAVEHCCYRRGTDRTRAGPGQRRIRRCTWSVPRCPWSYGRSASGPNGFVSDAAIAFRVVR